MSKNTDFVEIGTVHCGGERIAPSHVAQLHCGHVAAWKLTNLEGELTLPMRWWPTGPDRILPDLLAMIGIHVFAMRIRTPELGGLAVHPRPADHRELDAIAKRVLKKNRLFLSFQVSPTSFIQRSDLCGLEGLSFEVVERTSSRIWDRDTQDWVSTGFDSHLGNWECE
jgi:hypothetical protein